MPASHDIRGVQHIGIVVPDVRVAAEFLVKGLDAELLFEIGPFDVDAERAVRYDVAPGCTLVRLALLHCAGGPNLELFEFETDEPGSGPRRNNQVGGHHVAFHVDKIEPVAERLEALGATPCGTPALVPAGPLEGLRWQYVRTPWNSYIELVEIPVDGVGFEHEDDRSMFRP